jgi:hypothetical protein
MVRITDIPAEVRWEIAARAANSQSVACDMLVRQLIGDKIDEIWNMIMTEAGRQSKAMAESLRLPASNALEIDSTLGIISSIIMGPEFRWETLDAGETHVIGRIDGCPMLNAHRNLGQDKPTGTASHCQAFCSSSVQSLNPQYTMRYTKRMCTGDDHCEYAIQLKK